MWPNGDASHFQAYKAQIVLESEYLMTNKGNYQEQFERMMRWYRRFEDIKLRRYKPFPDELDPQEVFFQVSDEIYAFFLNCYHLKDWIKNDDTVSQTAKKHVAKFIDDNECLRICADICNSIKHLKLDKKHRNSEDVALESALWISVGTASKFIHIKPTITNLTTQVEQDAFTLASDCVQKWQEFIEIHLETEGS